MLATGLPYWPVFPDVRAALAALRADGWNLAILTNCDRDLIAQSQRRLVVPFDAVVTAEDVGAYKPDVAHFRRFAASFAPGAGRVGARRPELVPRHPDEPRAGPADDLGRPARPA